jgi:hypothetical protein
MPRKSDADSVANDEALNDEIADTVETLQAELPTQPASLDTSLLQVQALGLMMLNAVNAQQNAYIASNASVLATVNRLIAVPSAAPQPAAKPAPAEQESAQQESGTPQPHKVTDV